MNKKFTAQDVEHYIRILRGGEQAIDQASMALVDELFSLLQAVKPCGDDDRHELWLTVERGPFEGFQDWRELSDEEKDECREEYERWWRTEYPDETVWFGMITTEYKQYRAIVLNHQIVVEIDPHRNKGYPLDITPFLHWLIAAASACIDRLRDGTYNQYVRDNLPNWHRVGTLVRSACWEAFPGMKEQNLGDLTASEINEFAQTVYAETTDKPRDRLPSMTAEMFFEFCALGYKANHYKNADTLSPRDLYRANADGRDDRLLEIDGASAEAFHTWLHGHERLGGHPWEVCRGGNSTHISLFVYEDEDGYYLTLAGSAWTRTVETVRFYLALVHNGVPVCVHEGDILAARVKGTEKIGIVPRGVFPAYCSSYFPRERIIDSMNLPLEKEAELSRLIEWQEIPEQQVL